ncbi:ATP-binding cassette subfamily F protein 3 [Ereboglobus sp. PH5-10]|uniref:ABC-F family ATP-binding cassette domain-containing protein n=1 Tax=Ereboglobus sp. PH5-10 TaxID=2940629 RepID=UPI002404DDDF|nr:ABC-F family ATP-binding cassette domain-containing protein [Ereboglobus sp. PH5-10]MDF9826021.1 ATP-binding cassette subfamily F protein 3 [Ereboglobus sp. PH5-10]
MLTLADVSKSYGTRELFSDVSLFIARTDRLGLVGANGAGKTTLFNLILGEERADTGTIEWERGADFGFLPQESAPVGDETILEIATSGKQLEPTEDNWDIDYTLEPRAKRILAGLGFREGDHHKQAKTFSGGWVMRAHLARLLVSEPSLLLLDEPTNHLDLEALLWFQDYLTRYPGGLVVISHDRAFLNALCTGILELRAGTLHYYHGNYDNYVTEKEARKAQQSALYKNQQREIAHLQEFVDRFGAKATLASRAKSKEKQIARLKEEAIEEPLDELKRINFRFPQPARSGLKVVELKDVYQAYGDHVVYRGDLEFMAERGQRIVLVGPNGAGKSTLLKILADVIPIQGGTRELGANVTAGYFAQNRLDTLRADATVFENVMELRTAENQLTEQQVRAILGAFLFRKDDVFKKVSVLSGGEKSRLALARLLVNPPNLLLMDEPTTHLDIPSIDALIGALKNYAGTLIFISHDVYFIRQIAQHVLHINAGRLTPYAGDYDYYLEKSKATDARAALTTAGFTNARPPQEKQSAAATGASQTAPAATPAKPRLTANQLRKLREEVGQLEKYVSELESQQNQLTAELEAPETYNTPGKAQQLNRDLSSVVDRLQAATADWEAAATRLLEAEG